MSSGVKRLVKHATVSVDHASESKRPHLDDQTERKTYESELTSAKQLNTDSTLDNDTQICDAIRDAITGDMQAVAKKTSTPNLRVKLVKLRNINRLLQLRLKESRDSVIKARQSAESKHLQLENLLYEVGHLEKQISACRSYRSRADDILLVPVEEFYANAPAKIARPEDTKNDKHELFKARLAWELEQRKMLAERLKEVEDEVDGVTARIDSKKALLDALRPRLKAVIDASGGLDDILQHKTEVGSATAPLSCPARRDQAEMALRLPQKLHAIYVKLHALFEVRCGVGIESVSIVPTPNSLESTGKDLASDPHDLSVTAEVTKDSSLLRVVISCFPGLDSLLIADGKLSLGGNNSSEMVSSAIAPLLNCSQLLLTNLTPRRSRKTLSLPQSVRCKLPPTLSEAARRMVVLAHPWIRTFAGDLPVTTDCVEQEDYLNSTLSADSLLRVVNERITARLALVSAFSDLESYQLPTNVFSDEDCLEFPPNLAATIRIVDCTLLGQLDGSKSLADVAAANLVELSASAVETKLTTSLQELGFFYRIRLEKNKMVLVADVIIPADYPQHWPMFFCSTTSTKPEIKAILEQMEDDVNVEIGRKFLMTIAARGAAPSEVMSKLFAAQLCQLAACWDVSCEATSRPMRRQQSRRGRDRMIAWRYDSQKGYTFIDEEPLAVYGAVAEMDAAAKLQWANDESEESSDESGDETEKREERLGGERRKQQSMEKIDPDWSAS